MHGKLAKMISITIILAALLKSIGAGDTLSKGESLTGSQTLTSNTGLFELGFFNTSTNRFYLSIRYIEFEPKPIVWVANRYKPLPDATASKLEISPNGNLQLHNGPHLFWNTTSSSTLPESVVAVLGNNGNLILRDGRPGLGVVFWQSFDHPTDTWLPGATLGGGRRLVSWRSDEDPSPGEFSAEISSDSTIVFKWKESAAYWESGSLGPGYSYVSFEKQSNNKWMLENTLSVTVSPNVSRLIFTMLVMDRHEGRLKRLTALGNDVWNWELLPAEPFCGAYGILAIDANTCECLHGFHMNTSPRPVGLRCERNTSLPPQDCEGYSEKGEGFMEIDEDVKWPYQGNRIDGAATHKLCRLACLWKCSCTAYSFNGSGCFVWQGDLYGMRREAVSPYPNPNPNQNQNQNLHVRLVSSDLPTPQSDRKSNKTMEVIIAIVVPGFVLLSLGGFFYNNRRTKHNEVTKEAGEDLLSFDFNLTNDRIILRTRSNMETDLPMFSYSSVSAATNNFSPQNKLGEGGFGPVYKGKLQNGEEIALKRLSQKSGQGFEEFRNEILLIAKLQHRNLVRLLGCCIDHVESILIYEYMRNKSLDLFLFGSNKQEILDWKTRTRIIEGIAQGLLYLHEYSRLHIIHRDLKASNILLDDEMNPKISDFGMARIFGGTDSRGYTNRIVGTFGYIAPEYALEGLFSIKSDVYSFGVLVLEIVSGKKNTGFYKTDSLHLLGHAWDLWISGRGVELVDGEVGALVANSTALRYINVGLLCVQENPNDRPNMSSVVSMLSSEIADLPPPKKPAFSTTNLLTSYSSKIKGGGDPSVNQLTVSDVMPR